MLAEIFARKERRLIRRTVKARTIEQFVDYHEDLLFDDLATFNRKLVDWLLAYNTVLPHYSLGQQSMV